MQKEDCFYLGKIVSKYSFKGEVLVKIDTDEPELYDTMESVFVSLRGNLIPFFIKRCRLHRSTLLRIDFEEVTSEDDANKIMGSELYLPLRFLPKLTGNKFYFHEIIGFTLIDDVHGDIGVVQSVNDTTSQALFEVQKGDKQLLVPITDDIIKKVDRDKKTIEVRTPDGLVELYLG